MREILMSLIVISIIVAVAIIISIVMNYGHFLVGIALFVIFILLMILTVFP